MTYTEYLDLVAQLATVNLKPGNRYITAAALGVLLKQASPDVDWKFFGKRSLSELLSDPLIQNRLSVIETDKKALAVQPIDRPATDSVSLETFNPLRKSVWDSFVLGTPTGKRFMHRHNGIVRMGLPAAPNPVDEWVEIAPISLEEQRKWAVEFLDGIRGKFDAVRSELLGGDTWHPHVFAEALRSADEAELRQWNRFRSARVSAVVKEWLSQHALPAERAFQSFPRGQHDKRAEQNAAKGTTPSLESDETRRIILDALSLLPLERLLEIPIPAGVMLSALSNAKPR
jgi:hypothetical protein